jgi:hypothetical protein
MPDPDEGSQVRYGMMTRLLTALLSALTSKSMKPPVVIGPVD